MPGKPDESNLLALVHVKDGKAEMPKKGEPLSAKQITAIREWIAAGAEDDTPAAAKGPVIDAEHPPMYKAPPVITSIAFSPNGKLLAVTGYHEVLLHKADGCGLVGRLVGLSETACSRWPSRRTASSSPSPAARRAASANCKSGTSRRNAEVFRIAHLRHALRRRAGRRTARRSPSAAPTTPCRAIDAETGKQVLFMGTHSDWVLGTVFSQDGLHLASVSRDMSVKLTEVAEQRFIDNVTSITPGVLKGGLMAVDRRPMKEKKMQKVPSDTPNAKPQVYDELLFGGADGTPRLYKMHRETKREIGDDANKLKVFDALPGRVSCVAFDGDGERFAAAASLDGNGEVRVYDVEKGTHIACEGRERPGLRRGLQPRRQATRLRRLRRRGVAERRRTGKLIRSFIVPRMATAKIEVNRQHIVRLPRMNRIFLFNSCSCLPAVCERRGALPAGAKVVKTRSYPPAKSC